MIRIENIQHMVKDDAIRRFFIERQWPRGVVRYIPHKEKSGQAREALARIDWRPQLAPSAALWAWFRHHPEKSEEFRSRYFRELEKKKKYWVPIAREADKGEVALLYRNRSVSFSPETFLKEFLEAQLEGRQIKKKVHAKFLGLPGQGVAPSVEKSISRKRALPLRREMSFDQKEGLTFVPTPQRKI